MLAVSRVLREWEARRSSQRASLFLLLATYVFLAGCSSASSPFPGSQAAKDEQTPRIEYDASGRIKGLFGLRHPSGDPTCRPEEFTVDFVNIERNEYLVFQLPSTFRVWVKVEGEMQQMLSDAGNAKAREFLSKGKKYKLRAYACDAIGHTSYETVSVELAN